MSALLGNATVRLRGVCMQLTNGLDIEIVVSIPGGWSGYGHPFELLISSVTLYVLPHLEVYYMCTL